jgi:serine/threonine-protein kinase
MGLTAPAQISAGSDATCAVAGGQAMCWGDADHGQLGDGTATRRLIPSTPVSGLASVAQVSAGDEWACARTTAGEVWCWGDGSGGQLGDGSVPYRTSPAEVAP